MKILDFPKDGRPRERFLKLGPEALSDAELMAMVLGTTRGEACKQGIVRQEERDRRVLDS